MEVLLVCAIFFFAIVHQQERTMEKANMEYRQCVREKNQIEESFEECDLKRFVAESKLEGK